MLTVVQDTWGAPSLITAIAPNAIPALGRFEDMWESKLHGLHSWLQAETRGRTDAITAAVYRGWRPVEGATERVALGQVQCVSGPGVWIWGPPGTIQCEVDLVRRMGELVLNIFAVKLRAFSQILWKSQHYQESLLLFLTFLYFSFILFTLVMPPSVILILPRT